MPASLGAVDFRVPGSQQEAVQGSGGTTGGGNSGPSAREIRAQQAAEAEAARQDRNARQAILNSQANAAWDGRDYAEALRLFQEQQKIFDGPNIREAIAMAKAQITAVAARAAADQVNASGDAAREKGDLTQAIAFYRKAMTHPDYNNAGMRKFVEDLEVLARNRAESDAAVRARTEQERRNRPEADRLNNQAATLLQSGKPDEALELLTKAKTLLPRDPKIVSNWWIAHANIALRNARLDEVIANFEAALQWDPENQAARSVLERARAQRQEQGAGVQSAFAETQRRLLSGTPVANPADRLTTPGTNAFGSVNSNPVLTPAVKVTPGGSTKAGDQLLGADLTAKSDQELTRNFDVGGARGGGPLGGITGAGPAGRPVSGPDPRLAAPLKELSDLQEKRSALETERNALIKERNSAGPSQMLIATLKLERKEAEYQSTLQAVTEKESAVALVRRKIETEISAAKDPDPAMPGAPGSGAPTSGTPTPGQGNPTPAEGDLGFLPH